MPEIKPDVETFAKIKVIGVGGSGGSAINRMIQEKIKGVDFIVANTDVQALHANKAAEKIHIGKDITKGLGAGMNPELGRQSAEESRNEIKEALSGADMVFITCGLGGGTGTGAAPVIAEIARESGALTIAVVTKPFDFEGPKRREIAERGFRELSAQVDTIITIPNERLFQLIDKKTSLLDAFKIADEILRQGVQGISEIITVPGIINVDFADVRAIMEGTGSALMGIGYASGENRATDAAKAAVDSPLLDITIDNAKGILFTITGGKDLGMYEINEAAKIITERADSEAKIIFGTVIDENLKDQIKITVIATGFDDASIYSNDFAANNYRPISKPVALKKEEINHHSSLPERKSISSKVESIFSRKKDRWEEEESPASDNSDKISQQLNTPRKQNVGHEEDLDIPAFIRKKMG
ncbi:MAG: cell division protein FtsZ [bacterium]